MRAVILDESQVGWESYEEKLTIGSGNRVLGIFRLQRHRLYSARTIAPGVYGSSCMVSPPGPLLVLIRGETETERSEEEYD